MPKISALKFAKEVLGVEPWIFQEEILAALGTSKRVAVRAGHKTGKTFAAATAALWHLFSSDDACVVVVTPTAAQFTRIMWPQVVSLVGNQSDARRYRDRVTLVTPDCSDVMTSRVSSRAAVVMDEGASIGLEIYGASHCAAWVLSLGTPLEAGASFRDAFSGADSGWSLVHASSVDAAKHTLHISGLATKEWCDERLREWGREDPRYQVRVLGNFAACAS